jgi:ribonuclease VapC
MIAIDSSAIIAIAFSENEAQEFTKIILENECVIGFPTFLEIRMVLSGTSGKIGLNTLDTFLKNLKITPIAFDETAYKWAAFAFETYGKGRHIASLNYGDCMAYAIAKTFNAPLLFKGQDFIHTDVKQAYL